MRLLLLIKDRFIIIFASVIGNAIEFFDFSIYIIMLPKFAEEIFPLNNPMASFLMSLAVFAAAFFTRPIGGLVFGIIADKYGRRKALIHSILLMSICTFSIGLIPSYQSIGILAPLLMVLFRLLQGLSLGGEFGSSTIFLTEYLEKRLGLAAGISISSLAFGALMATSIVPFIFSDIAPEYAWRLPFFIGGLLGGVGVCFRMIVSETPEYKKVVLLKQVSPAPLFDILKNHLNDFLLVIGVCAAGGAISYVLVAYVPIHLTVILSFNMAEVANIIFYGLIAYILSCLIFGYLVDLVGAVKILILSSISTIISSVPIFQIMELRVYEDIIIAVVALGVLAGSYCSAQMAFISKLFPTNIRCSAICFGHAIGIAILGGTFPFVALALANHFNNSLAPGMYLATCGFIGLSFAILSINKYGRSMSNALQG